MNLKLIIIFILFTNISVAQSFQKIHTDAILIDTHNDFLTKAVDLGYIMDAKLKGRTHSDLARMKEGGLDMQVFSVFCDGYKQNPFAYANLQMDSLDAVIKRNPDKITKVANMKDLIKVVKQVKIAAMIGIEGGHMIENDLNKLDVFFQRGVRYMTLTWNNSTDWATSAFDETHTKTLTHKGLTDFGKQVVKRMNAMGMIIDISHVGEQSMQDVLSITTKPIIASHSAVYNLCQHQRNLKDEQIKAIAKNGGVIQLNFYSGFIDPSYMKKADVVVTNHAIENDSLIKLGFSEYQREIFIFEKYKSELEPLRPLFAMLMEHMEYIIKLVGVDYVGIGSDFDGVECTPLGMDDVTDYPLITKALVEKGYSKKDIKKILGGNFLRVLKANEVK